MLVIAGWILVGLVVISLVTRNLTWPSHTVVIIATVVPYFALVALVAAILFAITGAVVGLMAALGLVVFLAVITIWPFISGGWHGNGPANLTVMTANILTGKADPQHLMDVARRSGAQVVALQETTAQSIAALQSVGIDEEFPHCILAPAETWKGVALWSRFPLRDAVITEHHSLLRIAARVAVDPLRPELDPTVICLHVIAPWPPDPAFWIEQLGALKSDLLARTGHVIALGDYNAVLDHQPFRALLTEGYADAAISARAWWIRTWPSVRGVPALICIDHVVTRGMRATRLRATRIRHTDHSALVADLAYE